MKVKTLKWFCVAIYTALVFMIILCILNIDSSKNQEVFQKEVTPVVYSNNNNSIQVVGNNNTINVKVVKHTPSKKTMYSEYANKIAITRWENFDLSFTVEDGLRLLKKIEKYSIIHGFTLEEGLTIVNVESDFKSDAYNKYGNAYGLTQVTPPCLTEYNWSHNTNYTLNDLFNEDINLEIGLWYYRYILTHYADHYDYITTTTPETTLRDAYICYNVGVTKFHTIGRDGRNELRRGVYPCDMYGSKKGDVYEPIKRYMRLASSWS